jgi:pimeloyl-ACP methyl ester carboxylesterase
MQCQLNNITVNYESIGEGRPILLIHGWTSNLHDMMRDMEPNFTRRKGWKRIYLDLPGHGKTPGMDWVTNQDRMLDVVLDFIDTLIPGQRIVMAGSSAGAYIARGVVHHRLALIDGLLQSVPVIVAEHAKRAVPAQVTLAKDPGLVSKLTPAEAEVLPMLVVQSRKVLDALKKGDESVDGAGDNEFREKIIGNPQNYAFSFDVDSLPQPCPAPALIVAGRQDSVVGYRDTWKILENYPRGTFAVLDRAGHFLDVEQQDLLRALVSEWLNRVEEYTRGGAGRLRADTGEQSQ